jgi:hypothetical protein
MKRLHLTCILARMPFAAAAVARANTIVSQTRTFSTRTGPFPTLQSAHTALRGMRERASIRT